MTDQEWEAILKNRMVKFGVVIISELSSINPDGLSLSSAKAIAKANDWTIRTVYIPAEKGIYFRVFYFKERKKDETIGN